MEQPNKIRTFLPWEEIEPEAQEQIKNTASLPFIWRHVAVMPDAHFGKGSTVGTVIATQGAIVPAAVGVDIGCGMIAVKTNLKREQLGDLAKLRASIERSIPMSAGRFNSKITESAQKRIAELETLADTDSSNQLGHKLYDNYSSNWREQLGTLGGGNHFIEICEDEAGTIWLTLHSGSRGVGNKIGMFYIGMAQKIMKKMFITVPDPDLAYLVEETPVFDSYMRDLKWAQRFAMLNREEMMDRVIKDVRYQVFGNNDAIIELERINCHHNFTQIESHCSICIDIQGNGNQKLLRQMGDYFSKVRDFLADYRPEYHSCGGLFLLSKQGDQLSAPLLKDALERIHDCLPLNVLSSLPGYIPDLSKPDLLCNCHNDHLPTVSYERNFVRKLAESYPDVVGKFYHKQGKLLEQFFFDTSLSLHNYNIVQCSDKHKKENIWVTRKGAIEASVGKLAMIPGSMGTRSYIVSGLGNEASFCSAPHGAGRRMSRKKANEQFKMADLEKAMEGIEYRKSDVLVDEIPMAYKDIDHVMQNAKDLVKIEHTLKQILNCKGD